MAQSNNNIGYTSGGGFSSHYSVPYFQEKAVKDYFTAANISGTMPYPGYKSGRGYPDVTFAGSGYAVFVGGQYYGLSGTSASCPAVAGLISSVNAARMAIGKGSLGWVHPALYANTSLFFNDITSGHIRCPAGGGIICCKQGYTATSGWDPASGLGSMNYGRMQEALVSLGQVNVDFREPSARPSATPSAKPTSSPTARPSPKPTNQPTPRPTRTPTEKPTLSPTRIPTVKPSTSFPSYKPSVKPSMPTYKPSSSKPSISLTPTVVLSANPTFSPSAAPSANPTFSPSAAPSTNPTIFLSAVPATTSRPTPTSTDISQPALISVSYSPTLSSSEFYLVVLKVYTVCVSTCRVASISISTDFFFLYMLSYNLLNESDVLFDAIRHCQEQL